MNLQTVNDISFNANIVFLKADVDVSENDPLNDPRIQAVINTAKVLIEKGVYKVIIAGYKGRPDGVPNTDCSLEFLAPHFSAKLETQVSFVSYEQMEAFSRQELYDSNTKVHLLENLRFWKGEDANDSEFVKLLMGSMADIYVNESFATSHRNNASVVGLPQAIKNKKGHAVAGIRFVKEVQELSQITNSKFENSVLLLSGVKEDKLSYVDSLKSHFKTILVGGRLPEYLGEVEKDLATLTMRNDPQTIVANLNQDKEDLTLNSVEIFESKIKNADLVFVSGPVGKFEDEGQRLGTSRIFNAVAQSKAYKIAAGGDTEDAIRLLNLQDKFDWISVGGGASLEFITNGTLPGIEALQ